MLQTTALWSDDLCVAMIRAMDKLGKLQIAWGDIPFGLVSILTFLLDHVS